MIPHVVILQLRRQLLEKQIQQLQEEAQQLIQQQAQQQAQQVTNKVSNTMNKLYSGSLLSDLYNGYTDMKRFRQILIYMSIFYNIILPVYYYPCIESKASLLSTGVSTILTILLVKTTGFNRLVYTATLVSRFPLVVWMLLSEPLHQIPKLIDTSSDLFSFWIRCSLILNSGLVILASFEVVAYLQGNTQMPSHRDTERKKY